MLQLIVIERINEHEEQLKTDEIVANKFKQTVTSLKRKKRMANANLLTCQALKRKFARVCVRVFRKAKSGKHVTLALT